jgi:Ca2+-binding RTX toxin-like protein
LTLANTIVGDNTEIFYPDVSGDVSGDVQSLGYNLIEDANGASIGGVTAGNQLGVDAGLAALSANGGPTLTQRLADGSPAIDAGRPQADGGCVDTDGVALTTDQRGERRPAVISSARCDIGAVENGPPGIPLCDGRVPTIVGTNGPDLLIGTTGDDVIVGWNGDDVIYGLRGNDVLCGGPGNDVLIGGSGDDRLFGKQDDDVLRGRDGDDFMRGGPGRDVFFESKGNDQLFGDEGDDVLNAGDGDDHLEGGDGRDTLIEAAAICWQGTPATITSTAATATTCWLVWGKPTCATAMGRPGSTSPTSLARR